MASTAKKIGNEEITKEFEVPAEIRPSASTSIFIPESTSTNVISLNSFTPNTISLDDNATTVLSLDDNSSNVVSLDLGDDAPSLSLGLDDGNSQSRNDNTHAVSASSAKANSDLKKVTQVLVQQVKKLAVQEKQLSTEVAKVGVVKKDLPTSIAKTIKTEMAVSQISSKKNFEVLQASQKAQFDALKQEIVQLLKNSIQEKTVSEKSGPQLNLVDVQLLTQEVLAARKAMDDDFQKVSNDIQELMKQRRQLESYIFDLRTEFDYKEKHIKVLESQRKLLEQTVADLEEDVKNYRGYLKK